MSDKAKEATPCDTWWGRYHVPVGQYGSWTIGPLSLWIERLAGEWRVARATSSDHLAPAVRVVLPDEGVDIMSLSEVTRFAVSGDDTTVSLTPALADRALISRPEKPFVVLPQDEITVFVSTSLWVRVEVGDPPRLLMEVPSYRPSDTWFGPDTMEGELCYAARDAMRLNLELVPLRAHRAVTAVHVRNRGMEALTVDRLQLPVAYLSLFEGPEGELWTEDVIFERSAASAVFELRLRETTGQRLGQRGALVTPPRMVLPDRLSVRALASLFGG